MSIILPAQQKKNKLISNLRDYRVYHKYLGLVLLFLVVISSVTGMLLGWKKNMDLLQPPTRKGSTPDLAQWIALVDMATIAQAALDSLTHTKNMAIERMEAQPQKGIIKIVFAEGYWEVQLNGSTGQVLSVARRHSDWIEKVHDGSIISDLFKLVSMNVLGFGLLGLTVTGFTLWLYPKRIRKLKHGIPE